LLILMELFTITVVTFSSYCKFKTVMVNNSININKTINNHFIL
jgi:hypothetical protein